jgi:primosomal protein N'
LSFPDFRSTEKALITFTRLHQLSVSLRRNIYIVTNEPESASRLLQPMSKIYDRDLKIRQPLQLPPFQAQIKLKISSTNKIKSKKKSLDILSQIKERNKNLPKDNNSNVIVRGPYQGLHNNKNQWFILLRGPQKTITGLCDGLGVDYVDLSPETVI